MEQGLETLLTRLEVNSKGELVAGFRDLGAVYFPQWKHLFAALLGRKFEDKSNEKLRELEDQLRANPKFYKILNKNHRIKEKYWLVYQLLCEIGLKDELPEFFEKGHYTQQARWRLANPGNLVKVPSSVFNGFREKNNINEEIEKLDRELYEQRKQAYATRTIGDLNDLFDNYDGNNFEEIKDKARGVSTLKSLDERVLEQRKKISDRIAHENAKLEDRAVITFKQTSKTSRKRELRLEQEDWHYLEKYNKKTGRNPYIRMPSASEILGKKWMFLDIEIPYFRREKPEVTWVGVTYIENGKERREIHTTHDIGETEFRGCKIFKYANESELVSKLSEAVNRENPDFVSSYNTRFDLIKLRETEAGFGIGEDETQPLFKVTTKFFERIGIKDRLVVDFLRWAKITRRYDINAKLETVAGFEKDISYDELEELEEKSLAGDKKSGKIIAGYLASDVSRLSQLFKSEEFRKNLEDVLWISENYDVGIERLFHSPNCINDCQEKEYFKELGTFRDSLPQNFRTKRTQQLKMQAKQAVMDKVVKKSIEFKDKKGVFEEVQKVYIPFGDFFREAISVRFPNAKKFYNLRDSHREDKKRLYFIEQYSLDLCRWLREDYGAFIKDSSKFEGLIERNKIIREDFEKVYHRFRNELERKVRHDSMDIAHDNLDEQIPHLPPKPRKDPPITKEVVEKSRAALAKLNRGHLKVSEVQEFLEPELNSFLHKYGLDLEDFAELANTRSKVKRKIRAFIGNYAVYPVKDKYFDAGELARIPASAINLEEVIAKRFNEINEFIKTNKIEVIAQEGNYLYIKGNRPILEKKDCPLVLVDDIKKVYNSDNVYYSKYGFYSHMKLKEEPDYHKTIFEMNVFREMLDSIMSGKYSHTDVCLKKALERFENEDISAKELVFFNKSNNRYLMFAEEGKEEKTYFISDKKFVPEGKVLAKDEEGREYFIDEEREREIKVYIGQISDFKPDFSKYKTRFLKTALQLLEAKPAEKLEEPQLELNLA